MCVIVCIAFASERSRCVAVHDRLHDVLLFHSLYNFPHDWFAEKCEIMNKKCSFWMLEQNKMEKNSEKLRNWQKYESIDFE